MVPILKSPRLAAYHVLISMKQRSRMIRLPSVLSAMLGALAICLAAEGLVGGAAAQQPPPPGPPQGGPGQPPVPGGPPGPGGPPPLFGPPPAPDGEGTPHKLDLVGPGGDFVLPGPEETIVIPGGTDSQGRPVIGGTQLTLHAKLTEDGVSLSKGLIWRIFDTAPGPDGKLPLVDSVEGGSAALTLPEGSYFVHAAFGRAGATQRIELDGAPLDETLVLEAGGIRLSAVVGDDYPLAPEKVTYEIYRLVEDGARELITPNAQEGRIVRLHAGTYNVVSRYGTLNAVVRADIEVKAGELTEAVIHHKGAEVTLKLVEQAGGEALANTRWSVLTQGGDTIHESVGAFPHIILTEGGYTAVARHGETTYSRDFEVRSGVNGDVEVRLSDIVEPEGERRTE